MGNPVAKLPLEEKEYLTPVETAVLLGMAKDTVYAELRKGNLGGFRVGPGGGRWKVSRKHIKDYLESREN